LRNFGEVGFRIAAADQFGEQCRIGGHVL
jgi:hypothetical protein